MSGPRKRDFSNGGRRGTFPAIRSFLIVSMYLRSIDSLAMQVNNVVRARISLREKRSPRIENLNSRIEGSRYTHQPSSSNASAGDNWQNWFSRRSEFLSVNLSQNWKWRLPWFSLVRRISSYSTYFCELLRTYVFRQFTSVDLVSCVMKKLDFKPSTSKYDFEASRLVLAKAVVPRSHNDLHFVPWRHWDLVFLHISSFPTSHCSIGHQDQSASLSWTS